MTFTCGGCNRDRDTDDPGQRICPDCRADLLEWFARAVMPDFDPGPTRWMGAARQVLDKAVWGNWQTKWKDTGRTVKGVKAFDPYLMVNGRWRKLDEEGNVI